MADAKAWEPEELRQRAMRAGWLTEHVGVAVEDADEVRVEPEPTDVLDPKVDALVQLVRGSADAGQSIRSIVLHGRELVVDLVMRLRATAKGSRLHPDLSWDGPEVTVAEQLARMERTQRRLQRLSGDAARELRLRLRLQTFGLEATLVAYAATELVDPRVMDPRRSLDVLAHADAEMTPNVIVRLGMARAYLDEVEAEDAVVDEHDDLWPLLESAWQRAMRRAGPVADAWADDVVRKGRAASSAGIDVRL